MDRKQEEESVSEITPKVDETPPVETKDLPLAEKQIAKDEEEERKEEGTGEVLTKTIEEEATIFTAEDEIEEVLEMEEITASESESSEGETSLNRELEELKKEKADLQDRFVRLKADFDNFKKRASKEKLEIVKYGNESFIKDILSAVDNIERILTFDFKEIEWETFKEGIELVLSEVNKTFSKYNVEAIDALGKPFDPNLHEAMQKIETDDSDPNTIVEQYQKGYLYHNKLLRPSMVVVAVPQGKDEKEGEETPQEEEKAIEKNDKDEEPTPVN